MKTIKINNIQKIKYKGPVYNLELTTTSEEDDLYWVEQKTGILTHNCLPKDISSLIGQITDGFDPIMLKACWEQNKRLRPDMDWAKIEGAVKSNT